MGCKISKDRGESSSVIQLNNSNSMPYTVDLSSYEAACKRDPDLRSFDSNLQARTSHVISAIVVGVEDRSLSFESLKEATGCLLETSQEVVKIILDSKKDIWNNPELLQLVEEYFENSLQTLDFCNELENCLKRARDSQLIINVALQHFEAEDEAVEKKYLRTLTELKNFKAAGNPFTEEFFQKFQSVYLQQALMLQKLQLRKSKLDKKLKSVKSWRKVSSIIFASAFAAVLICSVMAAAMAAPPVAAALAAASSVPIGSMGKWFNSLWKKYENALKAQKEMIGSMQFGTLIVIHDLDNIRVLVERLNIEMESLFQTADFAIEQVEAVKFGMEEIKKKVDMFMKSIEDLGEQANKCNRDIGRARSVVIQRIIRYPD